MEKDEPKVYENEIFKVYEVAGQRWDSFLEKFRQTTKTQVELITQVGIFAYKFIKLIIYKRKSCSQKIRSKCVFCYVTF